MNRTFSRREFIQTASIATVAAASLPSALAQTAKPLRWRLSACAHIHTPGFINLLKKRQRT